MPRPSRKPDRRAFSIKVTVAPRPMITDARGNEVRLYNSQRRLFRDRGFPQEDFRRVIARIRRGNLAGEAVRTSEEPWLTVDESDRKIAIAVFTCAPFLFIGFLAKYAATPKAEAALMWMFAGMAAFCTILGVLMWLEFRRTFPVKARPRYVASAMLAEGRCPSCAGRIDGITPEQDRAVVCPECGAAWSLAREGSDFTMFYVDDDGDEDE